MECELEFEIGLYNPLVSSSLIITFPNVDLDNKILFHYEYSHFIIENSNEEDFDSNEPISMKENYFNILSSKNQEEIGNLHISYNIN